MEYTSIDAAPHHLSAAYARFASNNFKPDRVPPPPPLCSLTTVYIISFAQVHLSPEGSKHGALHAVSPSDGVLHAHMSADQSCGLRHD